LKQHPERCKVSPMTKLPQKTLKIIHKTWLQFSRYVISVYHTVDFRLRSTLLSLYIRVSSWLKVCSTITEQLLLRLCWHAVHWGCEFFH